MATHFEIVHPVQHKPGKKHLLKRGAVVPANTFSDADATPLVASGTIKPLTLAVVEDEGSDSKILSPSKIAKLTNDELIAYASTTYNLTITGNKTELLAQIADAAKAAL